MLSQDANERTRRLWDRYAPRYDRQIRVSERLLFPGGRSWACSQASGDVLEVAVGLLNDHLRHCVTAAAAGSPEDRDVRLGEVTAVLRQVMKL